MSLRVDYDERAISQAAALSPVPGALLLHIGPYGVARLRRCGGAVPLADPAEGIKPTRQLRDPDARDDDEEFDEDEAL